MSHYIPKIRPSRSNIHARHNQELLRRADEISWVDCGALGLRVAYIYYSPERFYKTRTRKQEARPKKTKRSGTANEPTKTKLQLKGTEHEGQRNVSKPLYEGRGL